MSPLVRVVALLVMLGGTAAPAWAQSALEIMQTHRARQSARDEEERVLMKLVDRGGGVKQRTLARYLLRGRDDRDKILVRFLAPRDVEGTAVLTWEGRDGQDEQWLYLPALKRTKRIGASDKKNKFMGTEFTSDDLRPEAVALHRYTLAAEETLDGQPCWVIEAVPATERLAEEAAYGKRRLWVRKDSFAIVKREFYDRRGALEKVQLDRGLAPVTGTIWRPAEVEMANRQNGNRTILVIESRRVDAGLPENFFTEAELMRGGS